MWVIRILYAAARIRTDHDGRFVKRYKPARLLSRGRWADDGYLETTDDPDEALTFDTAKEALKLYRAENGTRYYDGEPNRPLTAWHCEIMTMENAKCLKR